MARQHIAARSTYWAISDGPKVNNKPYQDGDYRYYWDIYYEQTDEDKKPWNNRTKVTVVYYIQTHKSTSQYADVVSYPNGTSTSKIDGIVLKAYNTAKGDIVVGDNYRKRYIGEASKYIYHNTNGDASFKWSGSGFGMGTAESTYSLPHINRYSTLGDISTFVIDDGLSIPTTKYVSTYYNKLEVIVANEIIQTISNANDTVNISFTEEQLDRIYALVPTGETTNFTIKLTTYTNSGMSSVVGTHAKDVTGSFKIILPTVNGAICKDNAMYHEAHTGDSTRQTIIKGQSLINISIPTSMQAVANTRGATISEYVVEGIHIKYNANGSSAMLVDYDENGNEINRSRFSQNDHVIVYAVDSRGTSSLPYVQKFTKYIDYSPIQINTKNYRIERQNNGISRFIDVSFEGTWWTGNFGVTENALEPVVFYRVNEGQIWTNLDEFINGASVGFLDIDSLDTSEQGVFKYNGPVSSSDTDKGFDIKNSYDMVIGVMDTLTNFVLTLTVPYGEPAMAVYKNRAALGGPYDESLGGSQLWGDVYLNGESLNVSGGGSSTQKHTITLRPTSNYTVTTTSAYQRVYVRFATFVSTGSKLTFDATNNGILVGPGVSKITLSANCSYVWDGVEAGELSINIIKNETTTVVSAIGFKLANYMTSIVVSPIDIEVSEGDILKMYMNMNKTGKIGYVHNSTYIRAEVLE